MMSESESQPAGGEEGLREEAASQTAELGGVGPRPGCDARNPTTGNPCDLDRKHKGKHKDGSGARW